MSSPHFLSTFDWGLIDTFTSCRRVVAADYPSTFELKPEALQRVVEWLARL